MHLKLYGLSLSCKLEVLMSHKETQGNTRDWLRPLADCIGVNIGDLKCLRSSDNVIFLTLILG